MYNIQASANVFYDDSSSGLGFDLQHNAISAVSMIHHMQNGTPTGYKYFHEVVNEALKLRSPVKITSS